MIVKGIIKKGTYYDSVSLMKLSKELNNLDGILDSSVVMGTVENRTILASAGLYLKEFDDSDETDILVGVKASSEALADLALQKIDDLLKDQFKEQAGSTEQKIHSFESALKKLPGANLSIISITGKFAAGEAMKALMAGLHVMIFSDNVTIAEELKLKQYAHDHGLLLMGPDCGSAIINGIPLGFANKIRKGNIGIVAASGTGLQEVSSVISNFGGGISQAIGTGGRDVRQEVGGIMFLDAIRALGMDHETEVLVLVSKPPHPEVEKKISLEIKNIGKPVISILIGGDNTILRDAGAIPAKTLEEAGMIAASIALHKEVSLVHEMLNKRKSEIRDEAIILSAGKKGKFLRGIFSGGTLCDEAQLVLKDIIGFVNSNSPLDPQFRVKDLWKSEGNCIMDIGEDEFTFGRPHPMIDFTLRNRKILEEASDPMVAVILLDIVIGYGSHTDPVNELCPVLATVREISPNILIVGSVTGTEQDPQDRNKVIHELRKSGMIIMPSNVSASELAGEIIRQLSST